MTTPFLLHLLRHGAVEPNGRLMGRTDCAPTAEGITACVSQAADLAVETLIASDLSRARSAGEVLSAALHVPLTVDSRWRELAFGQWDGKATGDLDSAALGRFWAAPDCYPPHGGDRWSAFVELLAAGLADLPPAPTPVVKPGGGVRTAPTLLDVLHRQRGV